jgi:hypothetical protein
MIREKPRGFGVSCLALLETGIIFCIEKLVDHAHRFMNRSFNGGSRVHRGLSLTLASVLIGAHAPGHLWP